VSFVYLGNLFGWCSPVDVIGGTCGGEGRGVYSNAQCWVRGFTTMLVRGYLRDVTVTGEGFL
jgi:hypothetical protein